MFALDMDPGSNYIMREMLLRLITRFLLCPFSSFWNFFQINAEFIRKGFILSVNYGLDPFEIADSLP